MKLIKKLLSFLFVICLTASMLPAAFAESKDDSYFENRSWDQLIADLFEQHGITHDRITLGYYNTVTGEEHYYQPDKYMIGASIYKVPLNMAYAEKIYKGEMDWDSLTPYAPYEPMMRNSIINSNNEDSGTLMFNLGGTYRGFLNYIAPYLGVDINNVDPQYYNERYTARQYVTCLRTLYDNSERFPKIIETMKEAEPNNYFRLSEKRYEIAHKYGFWPDDLFIHINDVGIVYTDDPIILVIFTASVDNAYQVMSDYCTLMCDYTNYTRRQRLKAEAEEAAALKAALEAAKNDIESKALVSKNIEAVPSELELPEVNKPALIIAAAIVLAALVAIMILISSKQRKSKKVLLCTTIIICAATLAFFLMASSLGTVFARPKGDPQQAVNEFFDALTAGNYEQAYGYIYGYSSLGLENTPSDSVSQAVYDALKAGYKYELIGECSINKLSASQQIELTHLELPSMKADVSSLCIDKLEEIVMERSKAEVYDENKNFLPAVTAEAFELAVKELLESADKYSVSEEILLQLEYDGENWLIVPNADLIHALSGGIAN